MGRDRSGYGRDEDDSLYDSRYDSSYDSGVDWAADADQGQPRASGQPEYSDEPRALVTRPDGGLAITSPTSSQDDLLIVPGDGVSMGAPFIKRRERPLTLRLAMIGLIVVIMATGLFAATPLGASDFGQISAFQAVAGSVVFQKTPAFIYYTVKPGDDAESLAKHFHVQMGGIYELNELLAGQELVTGRAYKIPTDPNYGADYRPPTFVMTESGIGGGNVFGSNWWNSVSGTPSLESPCAPDGHGNPLGYKLHSPNWNSYWVRGYSWFHNGDDLAAKSGNPIHAAQAGQVIWAGWDGTNGLGWSVKINNCNHISTIYGHMQKVLVKAGDYVLAGDTVGLEGQTGWATGPHLHFMVEWDNVPVDPFPYYNSTYNITHYVA